MRATTIKKHFWRWQRIVRSRLGIGSRVNSPDRLFQENDLIPVALNIGAVNKVLYVGVAWYTYGYYKNIFKEVDITTLDISREQAVFGSRHHITGGLDSHELTGAQFDIVFLFGVLNYGINDTEALGAALTRIKRLLVPTGLCYLTVEENINRPEFSITSTDMIRTAEAMKYHVAPVSDWFEIAGSKAMTRFFILGIGSEAFKYAQQKIYGRTEHLDS